MTELATAIHTGPVNGCPVRFFRSPLDGPDMPWHSVDDLYASLDLNRAQRRHSKQMLRGGAYAASIRTVATADGITTIAPHYMAQGLIGAHETLGMAPPRTEAQYAVAATAAAKQLTKDMPAAAGLQYIMAAFRRGE